MKWGNEGNISGDNQNAKGTNTNLEQKLAWVGKYGTSWHIW